MKIFYFILNEKSNMLVFLQFLMFNINKIFKKKQTTLYLILLSIRVLFRIK